MDKSRLLVVFAILTVLLTPAIISDTSDGATEQAKLVVFMDGDIEYDAAFFAEGFFHIPPEPDHDNKRFIGWSLDGEIIDVSTFDFNTLPQSSIILYAEYEDAPGRLSENTLFFAIAIIIALIILAYLTAYILRPHR